MNEDWKEVGDRAFNLYFRIYDKEMDHDAAQEAAVGEITGAMDEHGIEFEWAWTVDLPPTAVEAIIRRIGERMRDCEKAVGHPLVVIFYGPCTLGLVTRCFRQRRNTVKTCSAV